MRALLTSSLSLAAILLVPPAFADPNCQGQLTRDLHRNDAGTYDAKAGTIADYLHLDPVDEDGKPQTYAQHGGGIYPADAINLLNCHLVKIRNDDGRGYRFDIVLNNTAANANEIIRSGVEQKLVEAGLNHADASNASQAYIEHPESACGKAAKSILSGATELVDVISDNGICQMK